MASTDALPVPRKNVAFRAYFDLRLNTGALNPGATGLDSEVSKDGGTMTDCTSEAVELATSSGHYYLDLTATEMNADSVVVQVKSTNTNNVTRTLIMYPQETGDIKVDVTSWLGTAPITPTLAGTPKVDVTHWIGTAAATPDTAGYPKVTHKVGTGTGELSITSGVVSGNVVQIVGSAEAASKLQAGDISITLGTVNITVAPTVTQFECADITEATTDHFKNGLVRWYSGVLKGQQALCTAYSLVGGRGRFTVSTMTDAPGSGDLCVIV